MINAKEKSLKFSVYFHDFIYFSWQFLPNKTFHTRVYLQFAEQFCSQIENIKAVFLSPYPCVFMLPVNLYIILIFFSHFLM